MALGTSTDPPNPPAGGPQHAEGGEQRGDQDHSGDHGVHVVAGCGAGCRPGRGGWRGVDNLVDVLFLTSGWASNCGKRGRGR